VLKDLKTTMLTSAHFVAIANINLHHV